MKLSLEPIPKLTSWRNRANEVVRIRPQTEAADTWQIATSHKASGEKVFRRPRMGECSRREFWDRLLILSTLISFQSLLLLSCSSRPYNKPKTIMSRLHGDPSSEGQFETQLKRVEIMELQIRGQDPVSFNQVHGDGLGLGITALIAMPTAILGAEQKPSTILIEGYKRAEREIPNPIVDQVIHIISKEHDFQLTGKLNKAGLFAVRGLLPDGLYTVRVGSDPYLIEQKFRLSGHRGHWIIHQER